MGAREIYEQLDGVACALCGDFPQWAMDSPEKTRINSVIATLRCSTCGARFFVKRLKGLAGNDLAISVEQQFETAQRIFSAFPSNNDFGVVKPYRLIPDKGLLFFEYVEGRNAADVLLDLNLDEQLVILARVGAWLRRFHDATGPTEGHVDLQQRLDSLTARLNGNHPSAAVFSRSLAYLSHELRRAGRKSFRHVGLHGDCKLENFLIQGAKVTGVDIAWQHRNVAEHDLAQFLAQLALSSASVRGRRLRKSAKQLELAFLRGYSIGNPDSMWLINWLRGYYYLSYWLSWRKRGYFQRIFWDIYFAPVLAKYLMAPGSGS